MTDLERSLFDFVDAGSIITQYLGYASLLGSIPKDSDPLQFRATKCLGINDSHVAAIEIELDETLEEIQQAFNDG